MPLHMDHEPENSNELALQDENPQGTRNTIMQIPRSGSSRRSLVTSHKSTTGLVAKVV